MAKPSRPKARAPGPQAAGIERVLVLADGEKPGVRDLVAEIEPWLAERVREVQVERDVRAFSKSQAPEASDRRGAAERAGAAPPPGTDDRSGRAERRRSDGRTERAATPRPDLVLVLGGDGAILAAVRAFAATPVPTLGINFGRVGFLASTESSQWRESLALVLDGHAAVEPRMRLSAEIHSQGGEVVRATALNDVVVTRGAYQGMLSLALQVGLDWLTNYRADGLIVASPSGSTAYSLAAGGPILAPKMEAFVVTPICPQALSHRPIVLQADSVLRLVLTRASGLTTVVVDGQGFYTLRVGDSLLLRRDPVPYPLLALPGLDPYRRLRERLGWRGSFEPDVFPPETQAFDGEPDTGEGGVL